MVQRAAAKLERHTTKPAIVAAAIAAGSSTRLPIACSHRRRNASRKPPKGAAQINGEGMGTASSSSAGTTWAVTQTGVTA